MAHKALSRIMERQPERFSSMALSPQRWKRISESPHPWEREALEYIRVNLPDQSPYFGWCNFTFIDEQSAVGLNEVDCRASTIREPFKSGYVLSISIS